MSFFEAFGSGVAPRFDSTDVRLVANHLHLPAIFSFAGTPRRQKERVRIFEFHQDLSNDAENLAQRLRLLNLFVGRLKTGIKIHPMKVGVIVILFQVVLDHAEHYSAAVLVEAAGWLLGFYRRQGLRKS